MFVIIWTVSRSGYPSQVPQSSAFKHPPGFKELRDRVSKFTGDGREDFGVWLLDFCEATNDCKWTDGMRAQWFSWFLTGSAKRTLNREDKQSWSSIIKITMEFTWTPARHM